MENGKEETSKIRPMPVNPFEGDAFFKRVETSFTVFWELDKCVFVNKTAGCLEPSAYIGEKV